MALQETASRILVMGTTGSGKSTLVERWVIQFINLVSGSTLSVSDGLKSCTSEVLESGPFSLDDQSVILIDTPGFDDTTRLDTDIITTISTYLANMYKQGVKLSGVIYMHRISDVRIAGTSLLSFRIFCELCGSESLSSALIVTTMWSAVDPKLGESRERELATTDDLFKPALDHGAQFVRHNGTLASAQAILRGLITNRNMTLRIQHELVNEGKALSDTAAGAELVRHFTEQAGRLEARSKKLHKQMKDALLAQCQEDRTMLQLELDEMRKGERHIENEIERLRKITSSAIDTQCDWESTDDLQVELPTQGQIKMVFQEELSRLRECPQNEAYPMSKVSQHLQPRSGKGKQQRTELARRVDHTPEETREVRTRNDAAAERQFGAMHRVEEAKREERSEVPFLIICGAVACKVVEFIAYTVF